MRRARAHGRGVQRKGAVRRAVIDISPGCTAQGAPAPRPPRTVASLLARGGVLLSAWGCQARTGPHSRFARAPATPS